MRDRVMEILSAYADIDLKKIDDDMTFNELDLDCDDILELLLPIEEEFGTQNLAENLKNISVDTTISQFIVMIRENL